MKNKFNKSSILYIVLFSQLSLTILLVLAYIESNNSSMMIGVIIVNIFIILFSFMLRTQMFTYIIFDDTYIKELYFRKKSKYVEWGKVDTISIIKRGIGYYCIVSSMSNDNRNSINIEFEVTNRKLRKLEKVCSNKKIRDSLNELLNTQWWKKD